MNQTAYKPAVTSFDWMTRRLGMALMGVAVLISLFFWVPFFLDPTHLSNRLYVTLSYWLGLPGLALVLAYHALRLLGYGKTSQTPTSR